MCGVFGFILTQPSELKGSLNALDRGLNLIRHRGPDGSGKWVSKDGRVGLGHVRLSIIDVEAGAQPMQSNSGRYSIVYNGEIYNYLELRKELGESGFHTKSDTEVILQAFERWGVDCVNHFRGMFSIAIWDSQEQRLFLARDRFGIKPLYWIKTLEGLFFASEIKALLPFLVERSVSSSALSEYFSFQFCIGEKTLFDGVYQFPAAHCALVSSNNIVLEPKRYWEVQYQIDYDHTESWFIERLKYLVNDSIRMHLRSDVEVGSYVSGGIDSSLIATLARTQQADKELKIFNGRFIDGLEYDESRYAQALADEKKMHLLITNISEQDFVDNISKIIWHLDQPIAGPGSFPQYMVSREASKHVKVVLGGQGGDEVFGGYARYLVAYFEQCVKGAIEGSLTNGNYLVTYESIISNLETLRQYKPMLQELWSSGLFGERDERYFRLVNRSNSIGNIIQPGVINHKEVFEEFRKIFWGNNVGKESYFDSMTHFDFKTLLPALLQVEDRMSMAHGIEARVPLLDHPLIEFAATIPADIKFRNGELKRLLKTVFSENLPVSIKNRKDKMGFPVPLNLWLKQNGPAREMMGDILGSQKAQSRSYLSKGISLDAILDSQSAHGRNLWGLLSLELWHKHFIDK